MKLSIRRLILSVVIAFGLWVYVVTVISPESEATFYNIPVIMDTDALDDHLMLTGSETPTVTLRLRGNRTDLNSLKVSDIIVTADLSKINSPGEKLLDYNVDFAGNASAYEIVSQNPGVITLEVTEWATKDVLVNVVLDGTLGADYVAYKDDMQLQHSSVTITGPKDAVDQIDQAVIRVELNESITESISTSYRYTLCNQEGEPVDAASITTNVAEIQVDLKIQRVKEVLLKVDVIYGGGASEEYSEVTLDVQSIKVSGSNELLDGLSMLTVGTVNLAEIPEETVLRFPVELPEGVENLSGVTEVEATVTFPGLATKTLSISRIVVTNVPAGMEYEIGTKKMEITFRGPQEQINALTENDVTLIVDLTGAGLGENVIKPAVSVDDGEVGVLNISGSILVTLAEETFAEVPDDDTNS